MPKQLRVGIAGIRHSHTPTLVRQWGETEDAEVVAAADSFPSARALASDEWGIPAIYETWDAMFDAEDLDVVTSTLPNTQHADIVDACAARGLPVLIEKPMASSLADADRMVQAAEAAGIPALINWPTLGQTAFENRRATGGGRGDRDASAIRVSRREPHRDSQGRAARLVPVAVRRGTGRRVMDRLRGLRRGALPAVDGAAAPAGGAGRVSDRAQRAGG